MPSPNPTVRRQHSGNAKPTTLSAPIANGTDTSFTIADATGWPDGSVGNFEATVNAGQSDVEKILCSTRVGTTVNVATRGHDSTTAAGHALGATVTHTISALEIDEMNQHTNATSGVHGATGTVVGTSDAQTLTNKTIDGGANTVTNIPKASVAGAPAGAFVGTTDAQTLTNKTIDATANTLTGVVVKSTVTAKGDLIAGTGSAAVARQAVGTDGQFLVADSTQTTGVKWATGSSTAHVQTFTASGTWTVPAGVTVADVTVVGGGGGGAAGDATNNGGGGGGGAEVVRQVVSGLTGTVTVTVGSGGAAGAAGGSSSFGSLTALGGAGGVTNGAGGNYAGTGTGGGWPGCGGVAGASGTSNGGKGQPGINGHGGGGGGGAGSVHSPGAASGDGSGGGGGGTAGSAGGAGTAGTANTGGGGGGGGGGSITAGAGGAGGSGVVIVKWVA